VRSGLGWRWGAWIKMLCRKKTAVSWVAENWEKVYKAAKHAAEEGRGRASGC